MIKHFDAALDKINYTPSFRKDHIEDIDEHIAVMNHPAIASPQSELYLQSILKYFITDVIEIIIQHWKNEITNNWLVLLYG
jgi:hypothetical protein